MDSINQINLDYLRSLAKGDHQFIITILELFIKNTPLAMKNMKDYFHKENWEDLMMEAHKIRPSFNFMGLKKMEETARLIEKQALKQSDIKSIENHILLLDESMAGVYNQIQQELNDLKHKDSSQKAVLSILNG